MDFREDKGLGRVTPILHDSYEWRELQKTLTALQIQLEALKGELNQIRSQKDDQHSDNVRRIHEIEERIEALELLINGDGSDDFPGLSRQVDRIETMGKTTVKLLGGLCALATLIILFLTFYIPWFESHHKVSTSSPLGVSQNQPQDATIPTLRSR